MNRFLKAVSIRKVVIVAIAIVGLLIFVRFIFKPSKYRSKSNLKPDKVSVSVQKVLNKPQKLSFEYYGMLRSGYIPFVTVETHGIYHEFHNMKIGDKVKKNQRLGKIENPELAINLENRKQSLKKSLNSFQSSIELDFPQYAPLWSEYSKKVLHDRYYEFPDFGDEQFQNFIENQGFRNQLYSVKKAQESVDNQLVVSNVEGTIAKKNIREGSYVSRGKVIYELSSTKGHEIEIALRKEHIPFLEKNKAYIFQVDNKNYTGYFNGSSPKINIANHSINSSFRLVDSYDLMAGEYLKLNLDIPVCEKCSKISTNAVYDNEAVYILENDSITRKEIHIFYEDMDYTYYSGLADETLVLDKFTNSQYLGKKAEIR